MMKARWILLGLSLITVLPPDARGDRLQKYQLPEFTPPVVQRPVETSPIYSDFETQIQNLTWEDKKKLLDTFVERGRVAAQNSKPAEAQYYEELSRILVRNMNP